MAVIAYINKGTRPPGVLRFPNQSTNLTPSTSTLLLFSSFLVPPRAAADSDSVSYVGKSGIFTLLDCGGPSSDDTAAASAPPSSKHASADLSELLAAIPSVAAPEGFGALSRAGASVRGVCVGDFSPETCRACLIAAAWSVTKGCGLAARRAGAWSNSCFVAYATYAAGANATLAAGAADHDNDDSAATTTGTGRKVLCHGDFAGLYVDGVDTLFKYPAFPDQTLAALATDLARGASRDRARMAAAGEASGRPGETVRALAQCARDLAEGDCLRCLQASARQAAASCGGDWSGWVHGGHVLSPGCYLRFAVNSGGSSALLARGDGAAVLRWVVGAFAVAALHLHGCAV